MKIALTGATGLLGATFVAKAKENQLVVSPLKRSEYDHTQSFSALSQLLDAMEPDVFIHCAANTHVDDCETSPECCYRDNTWLTSRLATVCNNYNIPFVYISSTGVYGNYKKTPYSEYNKTNPLNHHHSSKLAAEKEVQFVCESSLILRTGWLFGGDFSAPKNFVARRIQEARELSEPVMFSDPFQYGNPTFVDDLVDITFNLLNRKVSGIFNAVNSGHASRLEYVEAIIALYNGKIRVMPSTQKFQRLATVSENEAASNIKIEMFLDKPVPHWKDSLFNYMQLSEKLWKNKK